jgi:hypothetical protein
MAGLFLGRTATATWLTCFASILLCCACAPKTSAPPAPAPPPGSPARTSTDGAANPVTYFEFQVEKPAQRIPVPGYPKRPASETGQARVLAQFVVDTAGVPQMTTFHVLRATSSLSAIAVQEALKTIRYSPAEIGGRRVHQLVQEEFVF